MSKKILTIVPTLGKGGTERVAQTFAESYAHLGMDSRLFAVREGGIREEALKSKDIPFWIGSDDKNINSIRAWGADLVHLHSHPLTNSEYQIVRPLLESKIVFEQNVFSFPNLWTKDMFGSLQMSHWCDWKLRSCQNFISENSYIVPNPQDPESFKRCLESEIKDFKKKHRIPEDAIVLGRVGQSYKSKWFPILIDAFNELNRNNKKEIFLILVNAPRNIIDLAYASPFRQKTVIIDQVIGDAALSIVYSSIDIFVHAAEQGESFGNVLAESLLCETPVVALSTPWGDNSQCEVIEHGKGGFIAISPKGFIGAIQELIDKPELRKTLGINGRQSIIDKYDKIKVAKMVLDIAQSDQVRLSNEVLRKQVMDIYKRAYDSPSLASLFVLRFGLPAKLTFYTSGYGSILDLLRKLVKI